MSFDFVNTLPFIIELALGYLLLFDLPILSFCKLLEVS